MRFGTKLGLAGVVSSLLLVTTGWAQIVRDGSFEAFWLDPGRLATPPDGDTFWTYSVESGLVDAPIGDLVGGAPDGDNVAYFQSINGLRGSFEQTITLPAAGRYRLSYHQAGRMPFAGRGGNTTYDITLGSTVLATKNTVTAWAFTAEEVEFSAGAGDYVLKFALTPETANQQLALFDLIAIEQIGSALVIDQQPDSQQVPLGGAATFSVSVADIPPQELRYQWLFNGGAIVGETSNPLVIPNVISFHQGLYSVQITHTVSGDSITSDAAALTIGGGSTELTLDAYSAIEVVFPSQNGMSYQVERSMDSVNWESLGGPITGTGQDVHQYYRTEPGVKAQLLRVREL